MCLDSPRRSWPRGGLATCARWRRAASTRSRSSGGRASAASGRFMTTSGRRRRTGRCTSSPAATARSTPSTRCRTARRTIRAVTLSGVPQAYAEKFGLSRAGKAPPPIVIQRVGREAVLDEAVRDRSAAGTPPRSTTRRIHPVGEPDLDLGDLPGEGQPLRFSIEIGVRPKADARRVQGPRGPAPRGRGLRRGDHGELDELRERSAKLETVERAAQKGDFVVMDFVGSIDGVPFGGGEGRDQMIELGSGRLIPGFEEQLEGASAGEERTVKVDFPDDYGAEDLAGKSAEFAVTVKEIKAKELPELDDDFAAEEGFDTLDELREDIRARIAEAGGDPHRGRVPRGGAGLRRRGRHGRGAGRAGRGARPRAVGPDAPLALAPGDQQGGLPADLRPRARTRSSRPARRTPPRRCAARRCSPRSSRPRASSPPRRSCWRPSATTPSAPDRAKKLLERLKSSGRLDSLKEDLAQRRRVELVADSAKPIPAGEAATILPRQTRRRRARPF